MVRDSSFNSRTIHVDSFSDNAVLAFNNIMNLQTIALSDSEWLSSLPNNISMQETFKTRLLRLDLPPSTQRDAIRYFLHRWIRKLWFEARVKGSSLEDNSTAPNWLPEHDPNSRYRRPLHFCAVGRSLFHSAVGCVVLSDELAEPFGDGFNLYCGIFVSAVVDIAGIESGDVDGCCGVCGCPGCVCC